MQNFLQRRPLPSTWSSSIRPSHCSITLQGVTLAPPLTIRGRSSVRTEVKNLLQTNEEESHPPCVDHVTLVLDPDQMEAACLTLPLQVVEAVWKGSRLAVRRRLQGLQVDVE